MVVDLVLLKGHPVLYNCLKKIMNVTCTPQLNTFFDELSLLVPHKYSFSFDWLLSGTKPGFARDVTGYHSHLNIEGNKFFISEHVPDDIGLGQLSTSLEAAGKVRVFAMVDSWTQTVCHSLHNYLMNLLNEIPNDGSRDHGAAFERAIQKSQLYGCAYGYDLSAATDRLPLSLQTKIISSLFSKDFGEAWATLLVGRSYSFYNKKDDTYQSLKYSVGQPMGAKSS